MYSQFLNLLPSVKKIYKKFAEDEVIIINSFPMFTYILDSC